MATMFPRGRSGLRGSQSARGLEGSWVEPLAQTLFRDGLVGARDLRLQDFAG